MCATAMEGLLPGPGRVADAGVGCELGREREEYAKEVGGTRALAQVTFGSIGSIGTVTGVIVAGKLVGAKPASVSWLAPARWLRRRHLPAQWPLTSSLASGCFAMNSHRSHGIEVVDSRDHSRNPA